MNDIISNNSVHLIQDHGTPQSERLRLLALFARSSLAKPEKAKVINHLLRDSDPAIRKQALLHFDICCSDEGIDIIKDILNYEEDEDIVSCALFALSEVAPHQTAPMLMDWLRTGCPRRRVLAVRMFGRIHPGTAASILAPVCLYDVDLDVRYEAAVELATMGSVIGVPELKRAAASDSDLRRLVAAFLLTRLGDYQGWTVVLDALLRYSELQPIVQKALLARTRSELGVAEQPPPASDCELVASLVSLVRARSASSAAHSQEGQRDNV